MHNLKLLARQMKYYKKLNYNIFFQTGVCRSILFFNIFLFYSIVRPSFTNAKYSTKIVFDSVHLYVQQVNHKFVKVLKDLRLAHNIIGLH